MRWLTDSTSFSSTKRWTKLRKVQRLWPFSGALQASMMSCASTSPVSLGLAPSRGLSYSAVRRPACGKAATDVAYGALTTQQPFGDLSSLTWCTLAAVTQEQNAGQCLHAGGRQPVAQHRFQLMALLRREVNMFMLAHAATVHASTANLPSLALLSTEANGR